MHSCLEFSAEYVNVLTFSLFSFFNQCRMAKQYARNRVGFFYSVFSTFRYSNDTY